MISIPPKYAVSEAMASSEARSLHLAKVYGERKQSFCWAALLGAGIHGAHGGRDEMVIGYIRNQEKEDKRLDQLNLWK